ncbi:MAG: ComEC/Rec2 family competence protein [Clostridiales Family XIII bacterium]|nr:ComEC/Rec2 family competence protein [Clostridiales Family XIII bacterium]
MRRPFCFAFLFYIAGIITAYVFKPPQAVYLVMAAGAAGHVAYVVRSWRRWGVIHGVACRSAGVFLALFALGGCCCALSLGAVDPLEAMAGETVEIACEVLSMESKRLEPLYPSADGEGGASNYHKLIVAVKSVGGDASLGGNKALLRVMGVGPDPRALIGASIIAEGEASLPDSRRNPKCFDYRAYLKTVGVRAIVTCDSEAVRLADTGPYSPWGAFLNCLAGLKLSFLERLEGVMGQDGAALAAGMLFGDKASIDEDVYEAFQKNGTAHILSVSGLHVAMVYACIIGLMGGGKGPAQAAAAAVLLFFYAAMAGFTPSVLRASAMILTHIAAMLLRRRYDLLTGACAAAGAILAPNPLQLFNTGFQLSFLAIFTMAFAIPFLDRYLAPSGERRARANALARRRADDDARERRRRLAWGIEPREICRKALRGFLPVAVIQLGMAPYTAYAFNYFSPAALLLNVPVILLAGLIIPLCAALMPLTLLCAWTSGGLAYFCSVLFGAGASAAEMLISFMRFINERGNALPFGSFLAASPHEWVLALYYGLFFTLASESFRVLWQRKLKKAMAAAAAGLALVVFLASSAPGAGWDDSSLVFVDVGQGDCLHIRTPNGKNLLIDSGGGANRDVGRKTLLPYLLKNGARKIDFALVTHLHSDHYKGLTELAAVYPVDKIGVYEANALREGDICRETGAQAENIEYLYAGQMIYADDDVYIEALHPERESMDVYEGLMDEAADENKSSLVLKLTYKGTTVLMTGDMGFDGEERLLEKYGGGAKLECDVLKVGHHGSRYSTSDGFLAAVAPKMAVIQVGKNNYGHPSPDVLEKLENAGVKTFRNDLSGAVRLRVGGHGIMIRETALDGYRDA